MSAEATRRLFAGEPTPADLDAWLEGAGAVVDAIFGTGFDGEPREPAAAAIEAINRCGAPVIACDIASGVDASTGEVAGVAVEASLTVCFHGAKVGHRVAPGKWHTGELRRRPDRDPRRRPGGAGRRHDRAGGARARAPPRVGLDQVQLRQGRDRRRLARPDRRGPDVLAGGDPGRRRLRDRRRPGGPRAGLRAGPAGGDVGRRPGGDGCLVPASAKAVLGAFEGAAAGVFGPGLGRDPGSVELARELIGAIEAPLVLDADGLNAFAGELGPIAAREAPTVLTPHAGELGRLLGRDSEESGPTGSSVPARRRGPPAAIVVLKGDDTIVTDGERVAVNALSAPALATAGTGDVLSGICAALLARGLEPFAAACAAVLAHARAGRGGGRADRRRRVGDRHRRDRRRSRWGCVPPPPSNNLVAR